MLFRTIIMNTTVTVTVLRTYTSIHNKSDDMRSLGNIREFIMHLLDQVLNVSYKELFSLKFVLRFIESS